MASEINNNLKLNKSAALDSRLESVASYGSLLNPNTATNFLYEGATIYVIDEKADYQVQEDPDNPGQLIWVKLEIVSLVQGTINITVLTTNLDLSLCSPAIELCDKVLINVVDGTSPTISVISNMPTDREISFKIETGKSVIFKHTDYTIANSGQIVLETGANMTLTGRTIADELLILERNSSAIVQKGAMQYVRSDEWASSILQLVVEDNLTSSAINKALSANQGRVLENKKQNNISVLSPTRLTLNANSELTVLPYNKNKIIITWNDTKINSAVQNTPAMLAALVTTDSLIPLVYEDRYAVMTPAEGALTNKHLDFGIWLLPSGLSAAVQSNWFMIEGPTYVVQTQCSLFNVAIGSMPGATNFYTTKISTSTALGSLKDFVIFDELSGAGTGYSFKFKNAPAFYSNIYEIEYSVIFQNNDTTHIPIALNLWKLNNGLLTAPELNTNPAGVSALNNDFSPYNVSTMSLGGIAQFRMTVKKRVEVTSTDTPAYTCVVSTAAANFPAALGLQFGDLRITKLQ
jgi:hypothetical protein